MAGNNKLPLEKRTHWRKIKMIITDIAKYEKVNLANYDLSNIKCYTTVGENLKGEYVTYGANGNNSCWVSNNLYEVYEVPSKKNKSKRYRFCGEFIFLAYNTDFNYWLFGTLTDNIDFEKAQKIKKLVERANYNVTGLYHINAVSERDIRISKDKKSSECIHGGTVKKNFEFDGWSVRKEAFYKHGYKNQDILARILKYSGDSTKIIDTKEVKKYKKQNKWRKR